MLPQQESVLETCQRAENILREVQGGELVPGTDMLAQWETELGQVAALLESAHESITEEFKPRNNPAARQVLLGIRQRPHADVLLHHFLIHPHHRQCDKRTCQNLLYKK